MELRTVLITLVCLAAIQRLSAQEEKVRVELPGGVAMEVYRNPYTRFAP